MSTTETPKDQGTPPAAAPGGARPAAANGNGQHHRILYAILAVLVLVGGFAGIRTLRFYSQHQVTDDAQIEGDINPILPRVSGFVTDVEVRENQAVKAGDVLVKLDDRDLRSKAATAEGALKNAEAAVQTAEATLAAARANVQALVPLRDRTANDLRRYEPLHRSGEISGQQYDAATAAADAARAQLLAAQGQVGAAGAQVEAARASVRQKAADLDFARLQLGYTVIPAPVDGVVSRKSVEVGQFVQAGQQLMSVVQGNGVWVVANFKETQLRTMKEGQHATIDVDAYPKHEFHGRIESIAAATGARFALLPPDNATGNFTKVVQRVPVKILFSDPADPAHPLRVGMSVKVVIHQDEK